ncbi:MAG: hypothetical protein ACXADY_15965 [Candidatus Hodarchaeales archaeon]
MHEIKYFICPTSAIMPPSPLMKKLHRIGQGFSSRIHTFNLRQYPFFRSDLIRKMQRLKMIISL